MNSATNLQGMFEGATSFNQDIGRKFQKLETWAVYLRATSSFNQDIGDWNTSSLTSASSMFSGQVASIRISQLEHSKCN